MKNIFAVIILLGSFYNHLVAQPTQAEIDKAMKQAQEQMKKYGNDSLLNSSMKGMQEQQKQITDAMKNQPIKNSAATKGSLYALEPGAAENVDNWKFPAKNTALLSSLPKKIFTKTELISFLSDIYLQLSKKLPPGISTSVKAIAAKCNNDGNQMADAAVKGWYTDYREEGLLLMVKAAATSTNDGLILNNCAAILNMSGIEQKAIPILKYVLQSYPDNAMLLNNLGQAYAGLGETDTAMVYLGRCIKIDPVNPEANNTAGQIEASKGNKGKAVEYFKQSIKGAYSKPTELKMKRLKSDEKIAPLVKPRIKIPEYFNEFKYQFPQQCVSVDQAATAKAEFEAFRKTLMTQEQSYGARLQELEQTIGTKYQKGELNKARILRKTEFIAQPYYSFCVRMAGEVEDDFKKDLANLSNIVDKNFVRDQAALQQQYEKELKVINDKEWETSESRCKALNGLANQYLPQFAAITEELQKKHMLVFRTWFDQLVYWNYLTLEPTGDIYFRIQYYTTIIYYLNTLGSVGFTKIIEPCDFEPIVANCDSAKLKEIDCPINIEIPFVVGKFELNCKTFTLQAGEGVVFGYEKDFTTRKSTLDVGIGLKLELEAKFGPVHAGVSGSAGETLFITFDGNNRISDGGLKYDAKASGGVEANLGAKKETYTLEGGVGYKVGINSGWDFNEGPFKGMVGPAPETPVNKNVKVYKPAN